MKESVDQVNEEELRYPPTRDNPLLPPPIYTQLRHEPPRKVRIGDGWAWLITRHCDVRAALADPRLSSDNTKPNFPALIPLSPKPRALSFFRLDGAEHRRLRGVIAPYFTPRATSTYRPWVQEVVDHLLRVVQDATQPVDLVETFTDPLPSLVIGKLFGVPSNDVPFFRHYARKVTTASGRTANADDALGRLTEHLDRLIRTKLDDPGDDLIGRISTRHMATGELSHEDFLALIRLLLLAAHATANQIALSIILLLLHPEKQTVLNQPRQEVYRSLDELLRFASIVQYDLVRIATENLNISGRRIKPGEGVILALPSANHDERAFHEPDTLHLERDARSHLAFGHGEHKCPGGPLAMLEMEIALSTLFRRCPNLRLAVDHTSLPYRHDMLVYGVRKLPVTFTSSPK